MEGLLRDAVELNGIRYEWLGQSTMRLSGPLIAYTDPVMLDESPLPADLILITHHHVDHCLPDFIAPIRTDKTRIAAFHDSYVKYCAADLKGVRTVKVGQTIELSGARITATEAYSKRGFHAKGEGCGFIIELAGQRIYFAGDTARIPEMDGLGDIDVAILPIADNTYGIGLNDMAEAAAALRAKMTIPVHYTPPDEPDPSLTGAVLFSKDPRFFTRKEDPFRFSKILEGSGTRVEVLRKLTRPK